MSIVLLLHAVICAGVPADSVEILHDFVRLYDSRHTLNALNPCAGEREPSNGIVLPGIFLHPLNPDDAVAGFSIGKLPRTKGDEHLFLLFRLGFRDGIPWDTSNANGVAFKVFLNGEERFSENHRGTGWQARALCLDDQAGKALNVELRTNAIDGNTSYDWAVFGQPMIVRISPSPAYETMRPDTVGIAMVEVEASTPCTAQVRMGPATERIPLKAGANWVPLHFAEVSPVRVESDGGAVKVARVFAGAHTPKLAIMDFAFSTPLLIQGDAANLFARVRNIGLGSYFGGGTLSVAQGARKLAGGYGWTEIPLGVLRPGEEKVLAWQGVVPEKEVAKGELALELTNDTTTQLDGIQNLDYIVFPKPGKPTIIAGTDWRRIQIHSGAEGQAYGVIEVRDEAGNWMRMGSVYPLAELRTSRSKGKNHILPFRIIECTGDAKSTILTGTADDGWNVNIKLTQNDAGNRIHVECEAIPDSDNKVVAFRSPVLLVGDRSFGAKKDFAAFPGLEYLEGSEGSSSTRDLAYPLSDRRVPAAYKIATPLIAVQAQSAMVSLLWDAHQEWKTGETLPAARFNAPACDNPSTAGYDYIHCELFAPSVGKYLKENAFEAETPVEVKAGEALRLDSWIVLDHLNRYPVDSVPRGPHKGGLLLQAFTHWFDQYGFPEPAVQPRPWDEERALCRKAFHESVWTESPPGWAHCQGWPAGLHVGYSVPLLLDMRLGVDSMTRAESQRRIDAVIGRAIKENGPHSLWSHTGCHTLLGELPFYEGFVARSMLDFGRRAEGLLSQRKDGVWVWHPSSAKMAALGKDGAHTLSQAALPSYYALRAARLAGNPELAAQALDAMRQMEQYEVPRGAQTWECPLFQPDILAAAQAIRAYTEAYRLTGDQTHLAHAKYWAMTGLPFLYLWNLDTHSTMRYNVISVMGSTFFTHSWIGLPVVWCGLVYAYALQDLAEFDTSFDWIKLAQGITNSAMWQQYTSGPSAGTYPDSWNMTENKPNPADINPENIMVNELRLRGVSPEPCWARISDPTVSGERIFVNTSAKILETVGNVQAGKMQLVIMAKDTAYTLISPVPEPKSVKGAGERYADEETLREKPKGWVYAPDLKSIVLKSTFNSTPVTVDVAW